MAGLKPPFMFGADGEDLTESVRDWSGLKMMLTGAEVIANNYIRRLIVTDWGTIFDFNLGALPGKASTTPSWTAGSFKDRIIKSIHLEHSDLFAGTRTTLYLHLEHKNKAHELLLTTVPVLGYYCRGVGGHLENDEFARQVKFTPGTRLLRLAKKDAEHDAY